MKYRDLYIEGGNHAITVKALASDVRLKILELLDYEELNIQELSKRLQLGKTTVLSHINILEQSGFIRTEYVPGTIGNQKMCIKQYDRLIFNFSQHKKEEEDFFEYTIPVGNYFDCSIYPPCGLASKNNVLYHWDDPNVFYKVDRVRASLAWTAFGYLEYYIPKSDLPDKEWHSMEISFELSSQGRINRHKTLAYPKDVSIKQFTDCLSDITFWLNDMELGTITVEEYAKGEGGKYTPTWWNGSNYGTLVTIKLDEEGCMINNMPTFSGIDFKGLLDTHTLRLKIGIKEDAKQISGFNLYGKDYGNYPQDIIVKFG